MTKLFRFLVVIGLLGVISSCDMAHYYPLDVDKLNTNIIEMPIDADSVRMEITYEAISWRCNVYLRVPDGCEVNEDSLAVTFSLPNYSCGKVEKRVIGTRGKPYPRKVSKIEPSHELSFVLYNSEEPNVFHSTPAHMYLKMSGVIVKDGKSLMNDTVTVVKLPKNLLKPRR